MNKRGVTLSPKPLKSLNKWANRLSLQDCVAACHLSLLPSERESAAQHFGMLKKAVLPLPLEFTPRYCTRLEIWTAIFCSWQRTTSLDAHSKTWSSLCAVARPRSNKETRLWKRKYTYMKIGVLILRES